jgi:hypothetical protein
MLFEPLVAFAEIARFIVIRGLLQLDVCDHPLLLLRACGANLRFVAEVAGPMDDDSVAVRFALCTELLRAA